MDKKININQVEQITGVSKRNIRFYEKEGLLIPERNETNGYREYGESDIWRVKVIKMLRMLDMPLDEIRDVLECEQTLEQAISNQKERLEEKAHELQTAIQFCEWLKMQEIQTLDVEQCLEEMEKEDAVGFFTAWVNDYKKVKELNEERDFTFIPDGAVTNAREFTNVLFEYAEKQKLNLVITKESMYPEFTLNGTEYTAERYYSSVRGIPVAHVHCYAKDREIKANGVPEKRKNIMWFIHKWWPIPVMIILDLFLIWKWFLPLNTSLEEWIIPIGLIAVQGGGLFRYYLFHYNEKVD